MSNQTERDRDPLSERPGLFGKKNATQMFFDLQAEKNVKLGRVQLTNIVLIILLIICVVTIKELFPLKTVKIYRMEVDKVANQVIVPMAATEYEPTLNDVRARLKELTIKMFEINPRQLKSNIIISQEFMSGQAGRQFSEFLSSERPFARIVEAPNLLREVEVTAVNQIAEKVILVDFKTKERVATGGATIKRKTITFSYEIKPARTDAEVLGPNPAGIYIVSFTISDVLGSGE